MRSSPALSFLILILFIAGLLGACRESNPTFNPHKWPPGQDGSKGGNGGSQANAAGGNGSSNANGGGGGGAAGMVRLNTHTSPVISGKISPGHTSGKIALW